MKYLKQIAAAGVLVMLCTGTLFSAEEQKEKKSYPGITSVKCKFALGDIELAASPDKKVHVELTYTHDKEYFEPRFITQGSRLVLEEEFFKENRMNNSGSSLWVLKLPAGTKIDVSTGTGSITVSGCDVKMDGNTGTGSIRLTDVKGGYELNTGTGNIEVMNGDGEFDLNTGTGSVDILETRGEFNVNSGTGKVKAENITVVYEGDFNSGISSVTVIAPRGEAFELSLSSGMGDAVLDMNGQPLDGHYEMKCNAFGGRIVAPMEFDNEYSYGDRRNKTTEKIFTHGSKDRRFSISTGMGKAVLKK